MEVTSREPARPNIVPIRGVTEPLRIGEWLKDMGVIAGTRAAASQAGLNPGTVQHAFELALGSLPIGREAYCTVRTVLEAHGLSEKHVLQLLDVACGRSPHSARVGDARSLASSRIARILGDAPNSDAPPVFVVGELNEEEVGVVVKALDADHRVVRVHSASTTLSRIYLESKRFFGRGDFEVLHDLNWHGTVRGILARDGVWLEVDTGGAGLVVSEVAYQENVQAWRTWAERLVEPRPALNRLVESFRIGSSKFPGLKGVAASERRTFELESEHRDQEILLVKRGVPMALLPVSAKIRRLAKRYDLPMLSSGDLDWAAIRARHQADLEHLEELVSHARRRQELASKLCVRALLDKRQWDAFVTIGAPPEDDFVGQLRYDREDVSAALRTLQVHEATYDRCTAGGHLRGWAVRFVASGRAFPALFPETATSFEILGDGSTLLVETFTKRGGYPRWFNYVSHLDPLAAIARNCFKNGWENSIGREPLRPLRNAR